jgi:hypothetical protein
MRQLSITPSITVTIGRHTRQYFAFVTTAPADLDTPATVTLHAGSFGDLAGFVADPFIHDITDTSIRARLVLVDAMELAWQRFALGHAGSAGSRHSGAGRPSGFGHNATVYAPERRDAQ